MKRFVPALFLLAVPLFAQRPLTVDDSPSLRIVSDPRLSPDGAQVVFTVRQSDLEDDKSHTHVWRVNWDGSGATQLTFSDDSENSPRWSPDGKRIAFLSSRGDDDENTQLWIM